MYKLLYIITVFLYIYIYIHWYDMLNDWLESLSVDYMRKKIADVSYISVSDISKHIKMHIISQKKKLINALS